ncbi:hypothetical protein ACCUM_4314 [Candidatus Accumulibacter phosphatis]|uniref:Uncharacterized protein n=1 Tax=Candidatus Accumulibacter phosphatis TaxID=327160 RepID=A0A5S4EM56_9PROT|nr:hypothetical protein ACCUM_4314 [Candidatus Accumulibacter phosphatis]
MSAAMAAETLEVPSSLMPKGVEHYNRNLSVGNVVAVPSSLMPKGVEHLAGLASSPPATGLCRHL